MTYGRRIAGLALAIIVSSSSSAFAQFASGSDGSDGELVYASGLGTVLFEPTVLTKPDGVTPLVTDLVNDDGIFHFTTITIGTGTTVYLRADTPGLAEGRSVVWLATGLVQIDGAVTLGGEGGWGAGQTPRPSIPGAGGFRGGERNTNVGGGPGGSTSGAAGHKNAVSGGGRAYGNPLLMPLTGGSGAAGIGGAGGGAGGGAMLLASSTAIVLTGQISARGGGGGWDGGLGVAGGGSGGGLRLVANSISGAGSLDVAGASSGSVGYIRVETYRGGTALAMTPGAYSRGFPGPLTMPANAPTLRVSEVNGVPVADPALGSYMAPDAIVNVSGNTTITIVAENIVDGTTVNVRIVQEDGTTTDDAVVLSGSTASLMKPLASGFIRIFLDASWNP